MVGVSRQPTYFIPHGGGPCFFMEWDPPHTWTAMREWLYSIPASLPQKPKAILIVSAHWEMPEFTVASHPAPSLIFDYQGFPPHTYNLTWPAKGETDLSQRVVDVCRAAGITMQTDNQYGFDHGVFIPMKVMYPDADIPTVALSIKQGYDPVAHLGLGRALSQFRDDNILIIGSGMSFHNLRAFRFRGEALVPNADYFDAWLTEAVTQSVSQERNNRLISWETAPFARFAHPEEDHLFPLHVVAGAAGDDVGQLAFRDIVMGTPISAYRFG